MPAITTIDPSAWPTSGAATAGTTGLNTTTNGTHVGLDANSLPPGVSATGCLEFAGGATDKLKIDADASILPGGAGDWYWYRMWVRLVNTGTPAADGTQAIVMTLGSGGISCRIAHKAPTSQREDARGFGYTQVNGFASQATTSYVCTPINSATGTCIAAYGQWFQLAFGFNYANTGTMLGFVNGQLAIKQTGFNPTAQAVGTFRTGMAFAFPAMTGFKWQAIPVDSWSGTDITIEPLYEMVKATDHLAKPLPVCGLDSDYGGLWDSGAGAGSVAETAYTAGTAEPRKMYHAFSGVKAIATQRDLGEPPYNSLGWGTLYFPMLLVPADGALTIAVRNVADDADILSLTIDDEELQQGGSKIADVSGTARYSLLVHLSSSGAATFTLVNMTTNSFQSASHVQGGNLAAWTPQTLGKLTMSASAGATAIHAEGVDLCRWVMAWLMDSLVASNYVSPDPVLNSPNHIAFYFGTYERTPLRWVGGTWHAERFGYPVHHSIPLIMGRSGNRRAWFTDNVLPNLAYTRGCIFVNVDGGSINDVTTSLADTAAAIAKADELDADVRAMCDALLPTNQVWLTTMIKRVQGTYGEFSLDAIDRFNAKLRVTARAKQQGGRLLFSDVAAAIADHSTLFTAGDDIHFNEAGDATYASTMIDTAFVNDVPPPAPRATWSPVWSPVWSQSFTPVG